MKRKKFKKGDNVTYTSVLSLPFGRYKFGGICHDGFVGVIVKYKIFNKDNNCWEIDVTTNSVGVNYSMLENEFLEFKTSKIKNEKK